MRNFKLALEFKSKMFLVTTSFLLENKPLLCMLIDDGPYIAWDTVSDPGSSPCLCGRYTDLRSPI